MALFRVSLYKKGKINVDFTQARDSDWQLSMSFFKKKMPHKTDMPRQWHQLGHMADFCNAPMV